MKYAQPAKPRPSGAFYLLPLGLWLLFSVGACVGGGAKVVTGVRDSVDSLQRVAVVDGGGSVQLDRGEQNVYYDEPGSSREVVNPGISFQVFDPTGGEVPTSVGGANIDYTEASDRSGTRIATFDADTDGTYRIEISGEPSQAAPAGASLAVGENVLSGARSGLIVLLTVGTIGFLTALVWAIVIARKRGRSKRLLQQGYPPAGGGPYPPPGGYGAGGPRGFGAGGPGGYGAGGPGGFGVGGSAPGGGYPPPGGGFPPPPPPPGQ